MSVVCANSTELTALWALQVTQCLQDAGLSRQQARAVFCVCLTVIDALEADPDADPETVCRLAHDAMQEQLAGRKVN